MNRGEKDLNKIVSFLNINRKQEESQRIEKERFISDELVEALQCDIFLQVEFAASKKFGGFFSMENETKEKHFYPIPEIKKLKGGNFEKQLELLKDGVDILSGMLYSMFEG